jgi:endonuclease YncB( thermonuclease family)
LNVADPILRALLFLALVCATSPSHPVVLASQAQDAVAGAGVQVIDGDTLQIDGHTVQLYGIDAPELGQYCEHNGELWECGVDAALFLQKTVEFGGPPIECPPWGEEPAGGGSTELVIGVCQVGPKVVGLTMVQNGYATALPDSFPDYKEAEKQARQAKLGLWRGDFVAPSEWRKGKGGDVRSSDWVRRCNVKGALGAAGEAIYYVPTDEAYDQVAVDEARGERMFCSDQEARAAGWSRPTGAPSDQ